MCVYKYTYRIESGGEASTTPEFDVFEVYLRHMRLYSHIMGRNGTMIFVIANVLTGPDSTS